MMHNNPTSVYLSTRANSSIHGASPHRLISLLFESCLENLAKAKGAIERKEIRQKAESLKKAMEIIVRLQAYLDFEKGGEIAKNLNYLYDFCTAKLALANAINDVEALNEAYRVVAELKVGWAEISEEAG